MHVVKYSADLCIADGMIDLDMWILQHEQKNRIPVVRKGQRWIFEEYVYDGEFHEPKLPWRLPSILDCSYLDRDRIVYINPNAVWINLVHPGDAVELFEFDWVSCCGSFVVSRAAKTLLQEISKDEIAAWLPGASIETMIDIIGEIYGMRLNYYSEVALLRLRRVVDLERVYEPLLLPEPNGES